MAQYEIEVLAEQSVYLRSSQPYTVYKTDELQLHFNRGYVGDLSLVPIRFPYTAFFGKVIKSFKLFAYFDTVSHIDFYSLSLNLYGAYGDGIELPLNLDHLDYYSLQEIKSKFQYSAKTTKYGTIGGVDPSSWLKRYNELEIGHGSLKINGVLYGGIILGSNPEESNVLTLQSSRVQFPPKLVAVVQNATPIINSVFPAEGYANPREAIRLEWELDSVETNVFGSIRQKSARLRWRKRGESSFLETIIQGSQRYYDIPKNTFSFADDYFEWDIQVTSTDDEVSAVSQLSKIAIRDSLSTVQPISPSSVYLIGNEANTFVWKHITATGTLQTSAELETSTDGQVWQPLQVVSGGVQQCVVASGTLTGDIRFWRVRTYNSDRIAGQWSEVVPIVVYAAPRPPAITSTEGTPLLTITWQSEEQKAYETKAGDLHSGAIYGTTKIYTFPQWFSDGAVVVGVRVQSSLGLWSEWATVRVNVINQPQAEVLLCARAVPHGVKLSWTGSHAAYIVYRDGEVIHSTTDTSFTDWLTSGKHRYQVRGVNGKFYAMSNTVTEFSVSPAGAVSDIEVIKWVLLRYRRGGSATTSGTVNKEVVMQYLQGRTKPVAEASEQLTAEHVYEYSFDTLGEVEELRRLVGHTVICKNGQTPAVIGILNPVSTTSDWGGVDVSFTITETDWKEGRSIANR